MNRRSMLNNSGITTNVKIKEEPNLITLSGGDVLTYWTFPKNLSRCPVIRCRFESEERSALIAHYKAIHAPISILCSLCNKPICVKPKSNFVMHYRTLHQNEKIPTMWINSSKTKVNVKTDPIIEPNSESDSDDEDDLITLRGMRRVTYWRFPPKLKQCPVQNCRSSFGVRSDAITHYRKRHADISVLCELCEKPLCVHNTADFIKHYNLVHPNVQIPLTSSPRKRRTMPAMIKSEVKLADQTESDSEDDLIQLSGCGVSTTWKFPKGIKKCPVQSCPASFGVRSDAIVHYKKRHAANSIYCSPCKKPVSVLTTNQFKSHFQAQHPKLEIPFNLGNKINARRNTMATFESRNVTERNVIEDNSDLITLHGCGQTTYWRFPANMKECPVHNCKSSFRLRLHAISHYKENHAKKSFYCEICDKPLCGPKRKTFIDHYRNVHPTHPIPQFPTEPQIPNKQEYNDEHDQNESVGLNNDGENECNEDNSDLITLHGCGQTTYWRFPEDMKNCPVPDCTSTFRIRSHAIIHYKKKHADQSIYCEKCEKPMSVKNPKDFVIHYQKLHPTHEVPIDLNESIISDLLMDEENEYEPSPQEMEANDNYDDLIKLSGCGISTEWRFPLKQKNCPVHLCRKTFESRSLAIDHYRENHADKSILCTICNKPLLAISFFSFEKHYKKSHPNVEIQFKSDIQLNDSDETTDTLIELSGCNRTTFWTFPKNQKQCPVNSCSKYFRSTADAIEHYKQCHAPRSILCDICVTPISAKHFSYFIGHYKRIHPGKTNPYGLIEFQSKGHHTPTTDDAVSDETSSGHEIQERKVTVLCPLMICTHKPTNMETLMVHWREQHADYKFPQLRPEFMYNIVEQETEAIESRGQSSTNSGDEESKVVQELGDPTSSDNLLVPMNIATPSPTLTTYISSDSSEATTYHFACSDCNKTFRSEDGLRKHSMIQHNKPLSQTMVDKRKRRTMNDGQDDDLNRDNKRTKLDMGELQEPLETSSLTKSVETAQRENEIDGCVDQPESSTIDPEQQAPEAGGNEKENNTEPNPCAEDDAYSDPELYVISEDSSDEADL